MITIKEAAAAFAREQRCIQAAQGEQGRIKAEVIAQHSPRTIGEIINAKTANGGIACLASVDSISVDFADDGAACFRIGARKLNRDNSVSRIECYEYIRVTVQA